MDFNKSLEKYKLAADYFLKNYNDEKIKKILKDAIKEFRKVIIETGVKVSYCSICNSSIPRLLGIPFKVSDEMVTQKMIDYKIPEQISDSLIECNQKLLQNEKIMAEWRIRLSNNEIIEKEYGIPLSKQEKEYGISHLVYDGIIDYYKFYNATPKILFILRETNNEQQWVDIESFTLGQSPNMSYLIKKAEPSHTTYGPVAKWANIVLSRGLDTSEPKSISAVLENVAIMNLSKLPGGSSTRETGNRYKKIAKENIDLLKKQFENIQPTVIVCCGDMDDYKIIDDFTGYSSIQCKNNSIPNLSSRTFTVRSNADKTFFFFPHPANPNGLNKFYEAELIKYMQSINK